VNTKSPETFALLSERSVIVNKQSQKGDKPKRKASEAAGGMDSEA
jgi:hypothetical protein